MENEQTARSQWAFSPTKTIALSLPLFIVISLFIGPDIWETAAGVLGWTGPNVARQIHLWVLDSGFVAMVLIATFLCCPVAARHCNSSVGHDALRRFLLITHLFCAIAFLGGLITYLLFVGHYLLKR